MIIPKLHYISQGNSPKEHLVNIQKACTSGAELVQLHLENCSEKKFLKIATEARKITMHYQTRLIIKEHYKIAKEIKADGVFLDASHSCPTIAKKHLYTWQSIGASANTLQNCETLLEKEIDYIVLSPFKSTTNEPETSTALGLTGYKAILDVLHTTTPIIGHGQITTEDVTAILDTGVSGLAIADAVTKNFDSIKVFHQLLKASSIAEQRHSFKQE